MAARFSGVCSACQRCERSRKSGPSLGVRRGVRRRLELWSRSSAEGMAGEGAPPGRQRCESPRLSCRSVRSSGSGELVINEVDYDQPGTDTAEFIEIYNRGNGPADLSAVELELINGSGNVVYETIALSAAGTTLPAGGYLVLGTSSVIASLPPGTPSILFGAADNNVQNGGSNGDGIKLLEGGTVLDSMSYEAIISGVTEGANHAGNDDSGTTQSLARVPNGTDTDQNADDFRLTQSVTPGAANQ